MELSSIDEAITHGERRWPHLQFKRKNANEASAPCPFCQQAVKDGFIIFINGGYLCRKCGIKGWLDEDEPRKLTDKELTEIRLRKIEREQMEIKKRLTALERMHRCTDHLTYHNNLTDGDRAYWHYEGMTDATIDKYLLGVCHNCPTDKLRRPSYTIPVINSGSLCNIRHRLINADNGDKYRPHMSGLPATLYLADNVYADTPSILICEGEKKALVVNQEGFPAVGTMGQCGFKKGWEVRFTQFHLVYVVYDPDAWDKAKETAALFGDRGRAVKLPCKSDDFFSRHKGTHSEFEEFLRLGKVVRT